MSCFEGVCPQTLSGTHTGAAHRSSSAPAPFSGRPAWHPRPPRHPHQVYPGDSLGPPALSLGSVLTHLPPCFCTWAKHRAHSLPEGPPRAGLLGKLAPQEENLPDGKWEELGQRIPHPFSFRGLFQGALSPEAFQRTHTCLGTSAAVSLSLCHHNNQVTCHYTALFASGLCFPTSSCPRLVPRVRPFSAPFISHRLEACHRAHSTAFSLCPFL